MPCSLSFEAHSHKKAGGGYCFCCWSGGGAGHGRAWQGTVLMREWLLFWCVSRTVGGAGWLSFIVVLRREVGGAREREGGRFF